MCKTFILHTQKVKELAAKHLPVYFETPCTSSTFSKKEYLNQKTSLAKVDQRMDLAGSVVFQTVQNCRW